MCTSALHYLVGAYDEAVVDIRHKALVRRRAVQTRVTGVELAEERERHQRVQVEYENTVGKHQQQA